MPAADAGVDSGTDAGGLDPRAELPVQLIPLAGELAGADVEISGLAWYGEHLILLPQYADRSGNVFAIAGADIVSFLDGAVAGPLAATRIPFDADGRFWAMNYFFPGDDFLRPTSDPIADLWGESPTHAMRDDVERLIELEHDPAGITFTDAPPVQLELPLGGDSRNWEGVARLEGRGVLLATDRFPRTMLAFVALP